MKDQTMTVQTKSVNQKQSQSLPTSTYHRKPFYIAFLFYFLIAFEFAYMAGPFAAFFYSAYSPALNFLNDVAPISWLTQFFLPHVTHNNALWIINYHNVIGAVLAVIGFTFFLIGACRVYYNKLTKKGAATKGIYKYIRHPQYISFIICSFGLLLVWPRYIVVISFVTMLFVYYYLARAEEIECCQKFGQTYITYMENTNRFIPFIHIKGFKHSSPVLPLSLRILRGIAIYILTLSLSLGSAYFLHMLTIDNLYASYTDTSATIAICPLDSEKIDEVTNIAFSDSNVQSYLSNFAQNSSQAIHPSNAYLNYILPTTWFAAEVPMNGLTYRSGHKAPSNYDKTQYKLIITQAIPRTDHFASGKSILTSLYSRIPIVEIWVNLETKQVTQILDMPDNIKYDGIPEAIY